MKESQSPYPLLFEDQLELKQEFLDKLEKPKITAFHGIFEDKLNKLIKDIKRLRKDPTSKLKVKEMIKEAKALKKLIKKEKKEYHTHSIQVAMRIVNGQIGIDESFPSDRIKMLDISFRDGTLTIDFDIKPL